MAYLFEHTKFGFCWLDLLALLILLAVIVVFGVRNRDLKKQQKDLEDQLDDLYSGDAARSVRSGLWESIVFCVRRKPLPEDTAIV